MSPTRPRDDSPSGSARILVVDDEVSIADLVATALRFTGFEVMTAETGRAALAAIQGFAPSLVILDVMLPDMDGFEVCRRMRQDGETAPVIFLTARDGDEDKLAGFDGGGDDYVTKPFGLEELIARIRAVLRRAGGIADDEIRSLTYADLELDEVSHRVTRNGKAIELSPTEFRLLRFLMLNSERVVSKDQILDHVWQYDFGGNANVVETYISYLRRKVDGVEPHLIRTIRGFGYTLRLEA